MEVAQPAAATELSEALADFFRAARRARGRANQASGEDLSLAQFQLLEPLLDAPHTTGQLATAAGVASPTATRMLDGLVERGYAERASLPEDRRAVLVSLTPDGRAAVTERRARVVAGRARIAAAIDPSEQPLAADILRRLADVIEEL
jgi:DNA-binding MarR family transcriptional regulator